MKILLPVFLYLLIFLFTFTTAADPTYLYHSCSNTTTFTRNSTYQSNLNLLLSSLPSNATHNHFYNTTAGQDPNKVYGFFRCRGDVSTTVCQDCVNFATKDATERCPIEKQTLIWYDDCLLRYSNRSFFSIMDDRSILYLFNTQNVTDPVRFNDALGNLMNQGRTEAVNDPHKFATGKANITVFQSLYGLLQCTPDLSKSDCNICLAGAIAQLPICCGGKLGGRVLRPSCYIQYEVYPFYNETFTATAVPDPAPTPVLISALPPPSPKGERISSTKIIAIVVPTAVSAVLFFMGYCFISRIARKKYNALLQENAGNDITNAESLQLDFGTIEAATNKFSADNKLGEGGFGEVYKGILPSGQEIAVKTIKKLRPRRGRI